MTRSRTGWRAPLALAGLLALAWGCASGSPVVGGVRDAAPPDVPPPDVPPDTAIDAPPPVDVPPPMDVPFRCATDADCAGTPATPVCHVPSGRCVECVAAMDTCDPARHCDDATHTCVPGCRSDLGCAGATDRDAGADAGDGGEGVATPHCDVPRHVCVQCLADEHCPAGTVCMDRVCVPGCNATHPCPARQTCCPLGASGGCVDTTTDVNHCGACGAVCPPRASATPACVGGACGLACAEGTGDCNGTTDDGCETDTRTDTNHCGACGTRCALANATAGCAMGACRVVACAEGSGDCNAVAGDGCEVNLATDPMNCGACGARPMEVCDGRDNDCDRAIDEGCPVCLQPGMATRSIWQVHSDPEPRCFMRSFGRHGDPAMYDFTTIPAEDAAGWMPHADPMIAFSRPSRLCGTACTCLSGGDFTHFQTVFVVPEGFVVTSLRVAVDTVDDGVRITVFNSLHPTGIVDPGSYAFLGGGSTTDLARSIVPGRNRVVLTHVDDCCSTSAVASATITLNGMPIPNCAR